MRKSSSLLLSGARQAIHATTLRLHGFSLHAAVRYGPDQCKELEPLCRHITLRVFAANIRRSADADAQQSAKIPRNQHLVVRMLDL